MKYFLLVLLFLIQGCVFAREVLAPAIQFDLENYKDYFKKSTDYKVNLKSRYDYKITCDADIIGISWGDTENIKVFDMKDENGDIIDMKSTILKVKYETYTYIRLYKSTREIVNILVNVNPIYDNNINKSLGLCTIQPHR